MDAKLLRAFQRQYYNRCKPEEALQPNDERYVDVDALGAPSSRVRGANWVHKLSKPFELSDEPVFKLFTGLPGTGKSTELNRLARKLSDREGANLLAVKISAEAYLDLTCPIDIPDIILSIIHATELAVREAEGKAADEMPAEGFFERLWNGLTRTDSGLKSAELSIPNLFKLVFEMKTQPSLRQRILQVLAGRLNQFLDEACEELELLRGRAVARGRQGIVVIFDSLEKLRGSNTNWEEVLRSAERTFSDGAPHLKRLPIHALYTIPPALVSRRRFAQELFIPMLKLYSQEGERFEPGFEAATQIIRRRIPDEEFLAELFGQGRVTERLERLIEWSGGYPRELISMLQSALTLESWPLSDSDFERLLNEVGDQYRKIIPADTFAWLARVAVEHYYTLESDTHRQTAANMLDLNAVLRYLNDRDWCDLHPAVKRIPGVAAEIKRLTQPPE